MRTTWLVVGALLFSPRAAAEPPLTCPRGTSPVEQPAGRGPCGLPDWLPTDAIVLTCQTPAGALEGPFGAWGPAGAPLVTGTCRKGRLHGVVTAWYPVRSGAKSAEKRSETRYVRGVRDGLTTLRDATGGTRLEAFFRGGKMTSWSSFDRQGTRTEHEGPIAAGDLVEASKVASKNGRFGQAITQCQTAVDLFPGREDQDAVMVCVIASCALKNQPSAERYLAMLHSDTRVAMGIEICARHGLTVATPAAKSPASPPPAEP
jgi:hypothetical protein